MRHVIQSGILAALLCSNAPAMAYDWTIEANVQNVEPTYFPSSISFQVNAAGGSCAAGAFLSWTPAGVDIATRISNGQAILSALLTAISTGKKVRLFGNNANCSIQYIHLLNY